MELDPAYSCKISPGNTNEYMWITYEGINDETRPVNHTLLRLWANGTWHSGIINHEHSACSQGGGGEQ
jgi:hypothetical protein